MEALRNSRKPIGIIKWVFLGSPYKFRKDFSGLKGGYLRHLEWYIMGFLKSSKIFAERASAGFFWGSFGGPSGFEADFFKDRLKKAGFIHPV